jgi:hypothetical protein
MTTTIKVSVLGLVLATAACAARPAIQATPVQRAAVVEVVARGGNAHDVAIELGMSDGDARRLVRAMARQLLAAR